MVVKQMKETVFGYLKKLQKGAKSTFVF